MKKQWFRISALLLGLLMLCACTTKQPIRETNPSVHETTAPQEFPRYHFSNMKYKRPNGEAATRALENSITLAQEDDFFALMEETERYNKLYFDVYTNYVLAQIHYHHDMTDDFWKAEYDYCAEIMAMLKAGNDTLMRKMANGPHQKILSSDQYYGSSFLQQYGTDSQWSDEYIALMEQEAELLSRYYELCSSVSTTKDLLDTCPSDLTELLADLVKVRQKIAVEAGYDSYEQYAFQSAYVRDYTIEDTEAYIDLIRDHLAPIYLQYCTTEATAPLAKGQTEEQTYQYLQQFTQAVGGQIQKSFEIMTNGALYDLTVSEKKKSNSYTITLPKYNLPYVFINPTGTSQDSIVFTHEFGHFCRQYTAGTGDNADVSEFYSQGMEYLSHHYTDGSLENSHILSSLANYVTQAALADFELRLYDLPAEDLTADNLRKIFREVTIDFLGEEYLRRDEFTDQLFVTIPHLYDSPMYVISYVASNDAALQVHQMEQNELGSGLALYNKMLSGKQTQFASLIQEAGLKNPFTEERLLEVRDFFRDYFA